MKGPMRPLQVYLDSSDFSNLSNPKRPAVYDDVEGKLLAWLDFNLIEIRFSYLHVVEASPVKPEDIDSSTARFQKILQLCGKKCFTSTISIIEQEISNPGEWKSSVYFDWLCRDDGDWLPNIEGLNIEDLSAYAMLRKEICEAAPDRSTRRKLERHWFDQQGKVRPAAKAKLRGSQAATVKEIEERFPLPLGAAQQLAECLAESDDPVKLQSLLRKSLSDLSCWPAWYKQHWGRVDPISSFLRRESSNLNECFAVVVQGLKQAYVEGLNSGLPSEELDRIWNKGFKEAVSPMYGNVVQRLADVQGIEPTTTDCANKWNLRPGLATALAVQCQIARRNMGLAGRPRQADEGDFGDVLHCVHLPFVDFFRTDGFAASAIIEAKLPFRTKVIPKLTQLPIAIEGRLRELGEL